MNLAETLRSRLVKHINTEPDSCRRRLLQGAGIFLLTSILPSGLARAQSRMSWIGDEWGPRAEGIRSFFDGHILATLHGEGQAAQLHDEANYRLTGERTFLQQEMVDKASELLALYPEKRGSLGFCNALVNAGILEPAPIITLGENEQRDPSLVDLEGVSLKIKKQLLMIYHADDFLVPLTLQEGLSYLDEGQWIGVQAPEQEGFWFRIGLARRGGNILVTAFGFPDKEISQSLVQFWYMPHKQGTEPRDGLIAGKIEEIGERTLRGRVANYYFSQRRENVIRHLVYLDPL